jgi:autotransporter strand-loop-strand O-heptosyltransferase
MRNSATGKGNLEVSDAATLAISMDVARLVPPPVSATPLSDDLATLAAAARETEPAARPDRPYRAPAEVPTQNGPSGVTFDFNDGCRVFVAAEDKQPWRVRIRDLDTGNILYETQLNAGRINSRKRYFVRFQLEVWRDGGAVFSHDYSAAGRDVLIQFPVGTLGDTLGWFPYAVKFQEQHKCRLTCAMAPWLIPLFSDTHPDIDFVTQDQIDPEQYYATYSIGLFFDDKDCVHQPCDFRQVGLHRTAGYILGVDPTETPARISVLDETRPIAEPYVCVAAQASTQAKYWNNPEGWRVIVAFLKEHGYRVICIDEKPTHGAGLIWNHIPFGAEDETGRRSLQERARWLKHAEFFIGLSSGLSWLAWTVGTPVVMISGFTHPTNEFATPHRVINYHACNSCWNDPAQRFNHKDFLWCPRHKDTSRQFECTRLITADLVRNVLRRMPGFGAKRPVPAEVPRLAGPPRLSVAAERGSRPGERPVGEMRETAP